MGQNQKVGRRVIWMDRQLHCIRYTVSTKITSFLMRINVYGYIYN